MHRTGKRVWSGRGLVAVIAFVAVATTPWLARTMFWRWELNPVLRGERLAIAQGCFHCHQPDGGKEIPNPGSRWGSVPRFRAGNAMMYATTPAEIEAFIRFGAPEAWINDEAAQARLNDQLVRMPAYDHRLSDDAIDDLVAFATAAETIELPDGEDVVAGRMLARRHGCTACHGVEGAGGRANPRSLGGFIPGFRGRNFDDLVRDRAEFDEWVRTGTSARLARNPIVRFFWRRQTVIMPAYGDHLDPDELDQVWAWVQSLRPSDGAS